MLIISLASNPSGMTILLKVIKIMASISDPIPLVLPAKCSIRGCPNNPAESLLVCANVTCTKAMHLTCFKRKYGTEGWFKLREGDVVCTKNCYSKLASPTRLNWTNDGLGGMQDPQTSERMLLDWLLQPGNYANKWKGNSGGKNKRQVAQAIAESINEQGTFVTRDAKQVQNKIQHIEKSFKNAHDFAYSETGAGLKENDEGGFNDAVIRLCSYYFDLLDLFADRASARPKATNMDGLSSSEEEEEEDVDIAEIQVDVNLEEDITPKKKLARSSSSISSQSAIKKGRRKNTSPGAPGGGSEYSIDAVTEAGVAVAQSRVQYMQAKTQAEEEKKKVAQMESNAISVETNRRAIRARMEALQDCREFVSNNPRWSREEILAAVPEFEGIIDLVIDKEM